MKKMTYPPWIIKSICFACVVMVSACNAPTTSDADPLGQFAGTHVRVVWVQEQGTGADTYGFGENFKLMGYDSQDGKQVRALLKETQNFYKPIITPDGKKVIVSSRSRHEIYLVDFKKGKKKLLGKGVAVDVWLDGDTGKTWVYALAGDGPENKYFTTRPLIRFPLKKPKKRETVWNKSHLSWSNFDLSRDGKFAGGLFPWPNAGILLFEQDSWKKYGKGCWTSLSPDNSAILWVFDGLHRNLNFVNPFTAEFWTTNINSAPGIGGFEVYHPRWSNHVRFLTLTGPYVEGEGGNKITGGGQKVEVYVGKFSSDLKTVESWFQVTHNAMADFYPDVWLANGSESDFSKIQTQPLLTTKEDQKFEWPGSSRQLLFLWKDSMAENKLDDDSVVGFVQYQVTARRNARFNRFLEMDFNRSGFETSLPGEKIAEIVRKNTGFGLELLFTPKSTDSAVTGDIVRVQDEEGGDTLRISQQGSLLKVEILANDGLVGSIEIPEGLKAHRPEHLFINIQGRQFQLYRNGSLLQTTTLGEYPFEAIRDTAILFGNSAEQSTGLKGALSHVAMYAGVNTESDISRRAQLVTGELEARQQIQTIRFTGTIVETSVVPTPGSLGAYRRALVVNRYRLDEVLRGDYSEREILVAQWAVLDRIVLPETENFKEGNGAELNVEKFDKHPELEGERLMMDMFDPDLELYYQVGS